MPRPKKWSQEQKDALYWRYKKPGPLVDDNADKNGPIVVKQPISPLPHPFKCSRCDYIGSSRADTNSHYNDSHYKE